MDGIHPKFVLSKRFPVHAAVEQLNLPELGTYHVPIIRKWLFFPNLFRKLTGFRKAIDSGLGREIPLWTEVNRNRNQCPPPGKDLEAVSRTGLATSVI